MRVEGLKCFNCKKKLPPLWKSQIAQGRGKYCSNRCANLGSNNHGWKEEPSYNTIHRWLHRNFTKPSACENCGKVKKLEWANTKDVYERERENYIALCHRCHRIYDALRRGGVYNQSGFHKLRKITTL